MAVRAKAQPIPKQAKNEETGGQAGGNSGRAVGKGVLIASHLSLFQKVCSITEGLFVNFKSEDQSMNECHD
jgi:hypothetical protein